MTRIECSIIEHDISEVPVAKPTKTRSAFGAEESALRSDIKSKLESIKPIGAPDGDTDVWDRVAPIDSKLVVTEIRPLVRERLGAPFPLRFVRKGGYESVDEAVDHLLPQLRQWCPPDGPSESQWTTKATASMHTVH